VDSAEPLEKLRFGRSDAGLVTAERSERALHIARVHTCVREGEPQAWIGTDSVGAREELGGQRRPAGFAERLRQLESRVGPRSAAGTDRREHLCGFTEPALSAERLAQH